MATTVDTSYPDIRLRLERQVLGRLDVFLREMAEDILRLHDAGQTARIYDNFMAPRPGAERWGDLLAGEIAEMNGRIAYEVGSRVAGDFGLDVPRQWSSRGMQNYLQDVSQQMGYGFSELVERGLRDFTDRASLESFLGEVRGSMRERLAREMVGTSANFASFDAAERAGVRFKQWRVTSGNPRPEHARLNGEVRPLGEPFSNGMAYPRGNGPPGQTANCKCVMVLARAGGGDAG